jgi:hypothetical protein
MRAIIIVVSLLSCDFIQNRILLVTIVPNVKLYESTFSAPRVVICGQTSLLREKLTISEVADHVCVAEP